MFQALLVAILGYVQTSMNPIAWWIFREPIMTGFWVGLIYGKPVEGAIIGAAINVAFLGWISAGGANPSDIYTAGLFGTTIALQAGLPVQQAVAIAVPLGVIGNYAWILWMSLNSFWPTLQDKFAEKGDVGKIILIQALGGQLLLFILRSLPAFLAAYYGPNLIQAIIQSLPAWVISGFNTVGKVLPALGLAMLMKYMIRKELIVFFALGFIISAYTGMTDLMFAALLGAAIGWIYISLKPNVQEQ